MRLNRRASLRRLPAKVGTQNIKKLILQSNNFQKKVVYANYENLQFDTSYTFHNAFFNCN